MLVPVLASVRCQPTTLLCPIACGWRAAPSLPLRSLGLAVTGSAAVLLWVLVAPAHLRATRSGVTPLTFRQLPPRSLRPPCGERRGELRGAWVSQWERPWGHGGAWHQQAERGGTAHECPLEC